MGLGGIGVGEAIVFLLLAAGLIALLMWLARQEP
jgi:hypothetical protein